MCQHESSGRTPCMVITGYFLFYDYTIHDNFVLTAILICSNIYISKVQKYNSAFLLTTLTTRAYVCVYNTLSHWLLLLTS